MLGMDWKTFQELNPVLRKKAAPPKRSIHVAVPSRLTAKAEEYLKKPVLVRSSARYASYKVRPGDTWWGVAKKHKVSVEALQAANKKGAAGKLQIGQGIRLFKSCTKKTPVSIFTVVKIFRAPQSFDKNFHYSSTSSSSSEIKTSLGLLPSRGPTTPIAVFFRTRGFASNRYSCIPKVFCVF